MSSIRNGLTGSFLLLVMVAAGVAFPSRDRADEEWSCARGVRGLEGAGLESGLARLRALSHEDLLRAAEDLLTLRCGGGPRRTPGPRRGGGAATVSAATRRPRASPTGADRGVQNTGVTVWISGPDPPLSPAELAEWGALARLYNATNGPGWLHSDGWNVSAPTRACGLTSWYGVTCQNGSVLELDLFGNRLSGTVPSNWTGLENLNSLHLAVNQLSGTVPSNWSGLGNLGYLDLSSNQLSGTVPSNWSGLDNLTALYVGSNQLSGTVPSGWVGLSNLDTLSLSSNQLSGTVPSSWSGLRGLVDLDLYANQLGGTAPSSWSGLDVLNTLSLFANQLSGTVPSSWGGLGSLSEVYLDSNRLSGTVPSNWSGLDNLDYLGISSNQLSGTVPSHWSGLDNLNTLDLSWNQLSGAVPPNWSGLDSLDALDLSANQLGGTVPSSWSGLGSLIAFDLSANPLSGTVPSSWSGLRNLASLYLHSSQLSGTLPQNWTGLENIETLYLAINRLSGTVPSSWSGLDNLGGVDLSANLLSGTVPSSWSGLGSLGVLDMSSNQLSGTVPSHWSGLGNLGTLLLSGNQLSGTVPSHWSGLDNVVTLEIFANQLSGTVPAGWSGLANLTTFDVSSNLLGGTVPSRWSGLDNLVSLGLSSNSLVGTLCPTLLSTLPSLASLRLSDNELAGTLPAEWLGNTSGLKTLDLSLNAGLGGTLDVGGSPPADLQVLDLAYCSFTGAVPAPLLVAPQLSSLNLTNNSFTDISTPLSALPPGQPLAPLVQLELSHNALAGSLPAAFCDLAAGLVALDLSKNRLTDVPACVLGIPNLLILDLSFNPLSASGLGGDLGTSDVEVLRLRNCSLPFSALQRLGSSDRLAELDVSDNPVAIGADTLLRQLLSLQFPLLSSLRASGCTLSGCVQSPMGPGVRQGASLSRLQLDANADFLGFCYGYDVQGDTIDGSFADAFPLLQQLSVSGTQLVFPPLLFPAGLVSVSRRNVLSADDCLPLSYLRSARLSDVNMRQSGGSSTSDDGGTGARCRQRTLELLEQSQFGRRVFPNSTLSCPQWLTVASQGFVDADARYLRWEQCRCPEGLYWRWDADGLDGICTSCPYSDAAGLRCDPYVILQRPCLRGNVYPYWPQQEQVAVAERKQADLVGATPLRCVRAGRCNRDPTPACPSDGSLPQYTDDAHSDAEVRSLQALSTDAFPPPLQFTCAPGFDPDSTLCSRCLPGHWSIGGSCSPCHGAAFRVLVVAALAAVLVGVLMWLWLWSGRQSGGFCTLSSLVLWLQLTGILEASSQAQSGNEGTTTWPWLAVISSVARGVFVVDPSAGVCVLPDARPDFVSESVVVLVSPLVVVAAAAACSFVLRLVGRVDGGTERVALVSGQLLVWLSLPVTTRALQAWNCESAGSGDVSVRFLSAAPYVSCSDLGPLRALSLVALLLFFFPALLFALRVVFGRRAATRPSSPPGAEMEMSLLGDDEGTVSEAGVLDGAGPLTSVHTIWRAADRLLFSTLRPGARWWWPVWHDFGWKVALALVVGLLPETSAFLPVSVFAVLVVASLSHQWERPWRRALDNLVEGAVLLLALGVYLLNIVGGASRHDQKGSGPNASSDLVRSLVSLVQLTVLVGLAIAAWRKERLQAWLEPALL